MTLASDLAAIYADPFLTVPVQHGASQARGFFDASVQGVDAQGLSVGVRVTVLRVLAAKVPGLQEEDDVVLGQPGDVDVTLNPTTWRVRQIQPVGMGLELDVMVAR